jgi:hypothetical protein
MCCLLAVLVFFGPRAVILLWWLFDERRWSFVYNTFFIPALGFLFLPWTTLMLAVIAKPAFDFGLYTFLDWIFIGIAVLIDITSYTGSAFGNRNRIPGYAR